MKRANLTVYDPGLTRTAIASSSITKINGGKGELFYRGYPIVELAEKSNFLEVAFLLINGELPNKQQFETWQNNVMMHSIVHENLLDLMKSFRYDARKLFLFS